MKTIEEILATDDAHREVVTCPEWGTDVLVVSMSAEERSDVEKRWGKKDVASDPGGFRTDVLERTLKKQDLTPFATPEQIKLLMKKNGGPVERLFEKGCKISGLSKEDVKELEKNS